MEMIKDFEKALEMGKRIYNSKAIEKVDADGKLIYSDEEAIKTLCSKVFSKDGEINSMEDLRSFNKLIVETANYEAQAKFEKVIGAVADYKAVGRYDQMVYYTIPERKQTTVVLSASGTGVDFTKIPSRQTKVPAIPEQRQFGVKYEISEVINNPVNAFRTAVDRVVEERLKLIFKGIMSLAKNGLATGKIPSAQYVDTANISLSAFRTVENKLIRAGRNARPVLIADNNFISALAVKQGTEGLGGTGLSWLTDEMRESFLRDVSFDMVSRSFAIATDNPFVDASLNDSTDLDPSEALLIAGADNSGSAFKVTEYGGMKVLQGTPDVEDEVIEFKISYAVNISLLPNGKIAYLRDTSINA